MKILLCNIPISTQPSTFPPVACTSLYNELLKAGYKPVFYDIDAKRPSFEELSNYLKEEQYDIVGISAVVSTGYKYVKELSNIIKSISPATKIVLGGNLAAAYEVILRKCAVDICVVGEGEKVLINLVKHLEKYGKYDPANSDLKIIKGIVFIHANQCVFTGHETPIASSEIPQPDYDLLAVSSSIDNYILNPFTRYDFAYDERSYQPERKDKKMATIFSSKGCVNKCTFCHRWIKGYRIITADKVIASMQYLKDKYNVGFFCISDECFGESKQWLDNFIRLVSPLDILFQVGGARVSIIKDDPSIIRRLKEAGLTALYFGMESGSDKILKVMEKNATKTDNLEAARICAQAGILTTIQLVIGMPGENEQTIDETIEFIKTSTEQLPYSPLISVNYLQSLPGTPTYGFLRYHGLLGNSIDDEEKYLLSVSDIDASDFRQYRNVSEAPLSVVKTWHTKIVFMSMINWLKKHNWDLRISRDDKYFQNPVAKKTVNSAISFFTERRILTCRIIAIMGVLFWKMLVISNRFKLYSIWKTVLLTIGLIEEDKKRSCYTLEAKSLRNIVENREVSVNKQYTRDSMII